MTNPTIEWIGPSRPFTTADLDRMPDDGHRYELIDGVLLVTPSPSAEHQSVVGNLLFGLKQACPSGFHVFPSPLDIDLSPDTRVQPDLLVTARHQVTRRRIVGVPLLAVEVLSPSTRHVDVGLKFSRYQAAGCPSYWVIDPEVPSITVWELQDGAYNQRAVARGTDRIDLERPFPISVVPDSLLR